MARVLHAKVSLNAFKHNLVLASSIADKQLCPIIKANAYGHGAVRLAQYLEEYYPQIGMVGVCSIDEAMVLRASGVTLPIILLEGIFSDAEIYQALHSRYTIVVHSSWQVEWFIKHKLTYPPPVWLKVNSGMNRLGLAQDLAHKYIEALLGIGITPVLMSHYSSADCDIAITEQQYQYANGIARQYNLIRSFANSACLLNHPTLAGEIARAGIMLYGATPDNSNPHQVGLKPVMQLTSEIIAIQHIEQGSSVGYGGSWQARQDTRIGIVACGYADGYPREITSDAYVCVESVPCKIIGRVSMDMLAIDLGDCPQGRITSKVEIWGNNPTINQVAAWSNTIAYTLLTRVNQRVPISYE